MRPGLVVAVVVAVVVAAAAVVFLVVAVGDNGKGTSGKGAGGKTGSDLHSLVVDPTNPQRVFVGGHEYVSVSEDGGKTWREIGSLDGADAMGWAFTADAVYVSGHPGLNRSTDGATTFTRINAGLPNTDVHAFGAGRNVLYGASPAAGVFASTDDGRTWQVRTTSAGPSLFGRIVIDPGNDDHLVATDAGAGVVESRDGGRSWQLLDSGLAAASWLSRSGDGLDVLVASGPAGAAISRDTGKTWARLDLPDGASLVEVSVSEPDVLYAARHQGERVQVSVSRDGGQTWPAP